MSVFADAYSRYLTNHFHYISKYKTFRKYFKNSVISLTDPNFMSKILIDKQDDFPKYPYFLNTFVRMDSVNLVKIYESSLDNTNNLVESMIGSPELGKKEFYDSIPSSLDNFLAETNFQFAYISTFEDLYNYDLIIRSFVSEYQYRNFFSDLYTPLFHSTDQADGTTAGLEDKSFLYQYMLYSSFYNVVYGSHNIYSNLLIYMTYINASGSRRDRVDSRTMLDGYGGIMDGGSPIPDGGFKVFVTSYADSMAVDLAGIIGKTMYEFENISQTMLGDLKTFINDKLLNSVNEVDGGTATFASSTSVTCSNSTLYETIKVGDTIYNSTNDTLLDAKPVLSKSDGATHSGPYILTLESAYAGTTGAGKTVSTVNNLYATFYKFYRPLASLSPTNFLTNNIIQYLDALISADIVSKVYIDSDIVDQNATEQQTLYETNEYGSYIGEMSESELKNYLFLCFLYKFWPIKFLNVLQLSLKEYVENSIKSPNDDMMEEEDYGDLYDYLVDNNINYTNLENFLINFITLTPSNYIHTVSLAYQVAEFSCYMFYIYVLDEFIKSTAYDDFIEDLTSDIFVYLRDSGHIDYSFDWYEYHDVIDVYFKTYLRWKLLDQSKRCVLSNNKNASYKFTNGSTFVYCADENSYNLISNNDYIVSENDSLEYACQVLSHSIIGTSYVLTLTSPYLGQTTTDKNYNVAYSYKSTDVPLFHNVTNNFANKLYPRVITNTTGDPSYDITITIPTAANLRNMFNTFSSSRAFIGSMHQFSENLVLSTLTRETIYSVLSDFIV